MARDHALALAVEGGGRAVLRFYRWSRPTLSLGRNEPGRGRFDPQRLREAGIDVVRRPTGGRAVLHHRELTYAVAAPLRSLEGIRATYLSVNRALRGGLASLGVPAEIADGPPDGVRLPAPDAGPCFRAPAPGEVVVGGRKLVGSAQVRIGRALLQHGSILVEDDQRRLSDLGEPADPVVPTFEQVRPATLSECLGGSVPDLAALQRSLLAGFRAEMGGVWEGDPPGFHDDQAGLEERYRGDGWTWRR